MELLICSTKKNTARCREVGAGNAVIFRSGDVWDLVPGEIVRVKPGKKWLYGGHPYVSGDVESVRIDVESLGLVPLKLSEHGVWDPRDECWGEEDEPVEEWAKPIIDRGPRQMYEMEQVMPGTEPNDFDSDPVTEAVDLNRYGAPCEARTILMKLLNVDLRCLDAHAHLGNFRFDFNPELAVRHYEVGVRIGELSLRSGFDDVLPWGLIDNRPFLRCLHGYGISLWRLGRPAEAEEIFKRMLWLNPSDNQGVRFLIDEVRRGVDWKP